LNRIKGVLQMHGADEMGLQLDCLNAREQVRVASMFLSITDRCHLEYLRPLTGELIDTGVVDLQSLGKKGVWCHVLLYKRALERISVADSHDCPKWLSQQGPC